MDVPFWLWAVFGAVVVGGLTIDLVAHRGAKTIGFKEAAVWSGVWVGLSIAFAVVVGVVVSPDAALSFGTAWLLEKSLSVDNLFVFALIFGYFKVPRAYQHRVLFFGVIGALVFRGIFLALGVAVVEQFTAILFVFAAILLFSAWKAMRGDDDSFDPGSSRAVRLLRRVVPVRDEYAGTKFFVREAGRRVATPLLAVVVAIEAADLVFAVDSVPAVLAVSSETFIVYTSNAFAILGLRALYFLLSGMLERFHLLSKGLAIILGFIGVAAAAGRARDDQHLGARDPDARQPRRHRRGAHRLGGRQPRPARARRRAHRRRARRARRARAARRPRRGALTA
ncbi:tellurium resistance protein TerC [Angustibacter aerolatus]|uniref:Tellurium resistance protein TerC n=1 Tax=Angustibacter aerolatus TaxID=1162965 RepID=A0ABQ6JM73_9ACTN|nr:TerC/Alx family metal homeostasis membrane protein [Angustibacter aerolatus]GMA87947.1 tellurium resistance protein TerC [Angustibacter aerolatus]